MISPPSASIAAMKPSAGGDQIRQHLAGPHRWELIHVAHHQQGGRPRDRPGQRRYQRRIDHRGLVDDQQVEMPRAGFRVPPHHHRLLAWRDVPGRGDIGQRPGGVIQSGDGLGRQKAGVTPTHRWPITIPPAGSLAVLTRGWNRRRWRWLKTGPILPLAVGTRFQCRPPSGRPSRGGRVPPGAVPRPEALRLRIGTAKPTIPPPPTFRAPLPNCFQIAAIRSMEAKNGPEGLSNSMTFLG